MNDRKLMQQALNALEQVVKYFNVDSTETKTIIALRERLAQPDLVPYWHGEFLKYNTTSDHRMMENAQGELERIKLVQTGVGIGKPEQEPVAWYHAEKYKTHFTSIPSEDLIESGYWKPLYTSPPANKPWVGLDNDDLVWIYSNSDNVGQAISNTEAKLKEKNT